MIKLLLLVQLTVASAAPIAQPAAPFASAWSPVLAMAFGDPKFTPALPPGFDRDVMARQFSAGFKTPRGQAFERRLIARLEAASSEIARQPDGTRMIAAQAVIAASIQEALDGAAPDELIAPEPAGPKPALFKEKAARAASMIGQVFRLPATLRDIHRIVKAEYTPEAMDENLYAMKGFLTQSEDPHYRQRTWEKVTVANITAAQVKGVSKNDMELMLRVAMEIEDPIMDYSHQSGEGFRFLLPSLGRFMGTNQEQADYAAKNDLPWCASAWCSEERRHGNALATMLTKVSGVAPARDNPNDVAKVAANETEAIEHVLSRETTEWNASSTYVVMAAHATGELRAFLHNVMRDEIKHLSVVSGADKYLFGPRPVGRLKDMLRIALGFLKYHKENRSGGAGIGSNPVLMVELVAAHVMSEYYAQRWLRTIPHETLQGIFEAKSTLPELAAFQPAPERQAEIDRQLAEGQAKRKSMTRWSFEKAKHEALLQLAAARQKENVESVSAEEAKLLKELEYRRLRDEQIRNNRHVKSKGE